jgi:multidrug efflux system membrane fusion protein
MNTTCRTHHRARRPVPAGIGLVLIVALGLEAGCSKPAPPKQPPTVRVHVAAAVQKPMPVQLNEVGTGEAYLTVNVKSRIDAVVDAVHFKEGQDVKQGDVLFTLDARPFQAALDQALASLARDTVQQKNAAMLADHTAELLKKGYAAQEDYDQARTSADALAAAVKADQAACQLAQLQLSYCTIASPIDARTGAVLVDAGNSIKANDVPLAVLNQVSPLYVSFAVPEENLSAIREQMAAGPLSVEALIPGEEDKPEQGTLTFVDNQVDTTTGTILLKGTFENKDRRLWPGQFVNVVLTLSVEHDAVVVPSQAVQVGQQGQFIFVLKPDETVQSRPVVVDREIGGQSVIAKGIAAGETVVTDGQLQLVSGTKVEVATEGEPAKEGPA